MAGKALRRNHSFIWSCHYSDSWDWSPDQPSRPGLSSSGSGSPRKAEVSQEAGPLALLAQGPPQATLSVYNVHLSPSLLPGQNEGLMDLKDVTFCFETEM